MSKETDTYWGNLTVFFSGKLNCVSSQEETKSIQIKEKSTEILDANTQCI